VLTTIPSIAEYQVRQTPSGVDADIVVRDRIAPGEVARALEVGLRGAGLATATAAVTAVKEIPRHPQTGKVRRFIPLERSGSQRQA
jgi:hypothetical protein